MTGALVSLILATQSALPHTLRKACASCDFLSTCLGTGGSPGSELGQPVSPASDCEIRLPRRLDMTPGESGCLIRIEYSSAS